MKPDYYTIFGQKAYQKGFDGIDFNDLDAVITRYHVLVATKHKDDKDTGGNALRTAWAKERLNAHMDPLPELLQPPSLDLGQLPFGSFYIRSTFKLLKPYISRDDNPFYIVDNPIVREKVFRYPMVRATAWKGSLRHALWQLGHTKDNHQIQRLFGTATDENPQKGNRGRLYFYPGFFTQTSVEIINPHDRERRVGKNPILIESVPIDADATFTLLYTPLDCIGKDEAENRQQISADRQQISADLQLVAEGLEALFTVYGFGAKTSSGFGLAANAVSEGTIVVGGLAYEPETPTPETASAAPSQPDLPRYLIAPDFVSDTGDLKSEDEYRKLIEGQGKKYAKKEKQLYAKAKGWWERNQQQLAQPPKEQETEPEAAPPYPLARETFETFNDLTAKAKKLADALCRTGGDE